MFFKNIGYKNVVWIADKKNEDVQIIEYNNSREINKRNKMPFDKQKVDDAKNGGYSLLSTVELLNAFVLIKTAELSLEEFDNIIHKVGLIQFKKRT